MPHSPWLHMIRTGVLCLFLFVFGILTRGRCVLGLPLLCHHCCLMHLDVLLLALFCCHWFAHELLTPHSACRHASHMVGEYLPFFAFSSLVSASSVYASNAGCHCFGLLSLFACCRPLPNSYIFSYYGNAVLLAECRHASQSVASLHSSGFSHYRKCISGRNTDSVQHQDQEQGVPSEPGEDDAGRQPV